MVVECTYALEDVDVETTSNVLPSMGCKLEPSTITGYVASLTRVRISELVLMLGGVEALAMWLKASSKSGRANNITTFQKKPRGSEQ